MAVKWSKIQETSTVGDLPTSSAVTYQTGINAPGGPIEFMQIRYDINFTTSPVVASDLMSLISNLRIVQNGVVIHDFVAGDSGNDNTQASQYGYVLNMTGGRAYEIPASGDATVREGYINIPLGTQTPKGVNRYEVTIGWAAAASAVVSGKVEFWLKMNDGMQTTTTMVPATSFVHSASQEQVVVRVPQNVPGVVSALVVLNDSAADEYGSQGLRINSLSEFGVEPGMYRSMSGEIQNGIQFNAGSTSDVQTFATSVKGALVIPTFGLTGGDIVLSVDSSTATTRRYIPVLTNPVGAKATPDVRQTQREVGNTAKAILKGNLQ